MVVIFLGIPFTLLYNYLSAILRAIGDSKTPFFFLAFSAGAMIAVVGAELLPEASIENKKLTTLGLILGFILMMVLDVALG